MLLELSVALVLFFFSLYGFFLYGFSLHGRCAAFHGGASLVVVGVVREGLRLPPLFDMAWASASQIPFDLVLQLVVDMGPMLTAAALDHRAFPFLR